MLKPANAFCAKAQRLRHDADQLVVATGRGVLRLTSFISADVWTPVEKRLKTAFISPPIEVGDFCTCRFAFATKTLAERS